VKDGSVSIAQEDMLGIKYAKNDLKQVILMSDEATKGEVVKCPLHSQC
jgi:hypothetical protein